MDRKNTTKTYICIAKSEDGRPARLFVQSFDENYVAVKPVEGDYDRPLWLPKEDVFRYAPDLLASLEEAYRKQDRDKLNRLWKRAAHWQPVEGGKTHASAKSK